MSRPGLPEIAFVRLTEVSREEILAHMQDPRVGEHMPLMTEPWDAQTVEGFIAAKEACWQRDGLGHWAILCDRCYVGWGGFQKEGEDWDFGLVLRPDAFGLGSRIAAKALDVAKADPRISHVTFLLAPSRRSLSALARLGARFVGEVEYEGTRFRKYRLDLAGDA